jgi:hypothetical protein
VSGRFIKKIIKKIIKNPFILGLFINLLFFALYGFPVYTSPFNSAHFALPKALGTSDLTGAIRIAEIFTKMDFSSGWSNFVNYPSGESIYSIQFLSQALPHLFLYVLSPLGPMFAVFFLQFLFTTLSTFGLIYFLKTYIKSNKVIFIVLTGFFMTNYLIDTLQAHLLGTLWGVPMLYLATLGRKIPKRKKGAIAATLIVVSVFSDIYLVYSIFLITLAFALHKYLFTIQSVKVHNKRDRKKDFDTKSVLNQKKLLACIIVFVSFPILLNSQTLKTLWEKIYSGGLLTEASSLGFDIFHLGYLQIFLFLSGILFISLRSQFNRDDQFLFVGIVVILLATVNFANSPLSPFTPVENYRKLLPNFDHNQRLVPILVTLVLILTIRLNMESLSTLLTVKAKIPSIFIYILATTIVCVRFLQLILSPHVAVHPAAYEEFRKTIPITQAYLTFPLTLEGRTWIQQGYINRATTNSLKGSNEDVLQAFENGASEVVTLFQTRNVNFLVIPCNTVPVLNETWEIRGKGFDHIFKFRNQIIDQGYEKGPTTICLYELNTKS